MIARGGGRKAGAAVAMAVLAAGWAAPAVADDAPSTHHHAKAAKPAGDDPVAAAVPPTAEIEHVVRPGETLGGIAARAHVPRVLIIEANHIAAPYAVRTGQHLVLPRTRHHVVAPGETGFDIAYRYGVPYEQIAVANGISIDDPLHVGQSLLIPSVLPGHAAPAAAAGALGSAGHHGAHASDGAHASGGDEGTGDDVGPLVQGKAHADAGTPAAASDSFAWPVAGRMVRGFGAAGTPQHHNGIDIAASPGTAVRAAAAGQVIFAGNEPVSFGNLVVVDHGNGWQTAYGFLDRITVEKGETVRPHERIGTLGHSGKAHGDELHFEIRKANSPVDPMTRLPARGGDDAAAAANDADATRRGASSADDAAPAHRPAHGAKAKHMAPHKAASGD